MASNRITRRRFLLTSSAPLSVALAGCSGKLPGNSQGDCEVEIRQEADSGVLSGIGVETTEGYAVLRIEVDKSATKAELDRIRIVQRGGDFFGNIPVMNEDIYRYNVGRQPFAAIFAITIVGRDHQPLDSATVRFVCQ